MQRIRGEILWKHNPTNPLAPEGAFLAAIAVAQQQKAKGFELLAALSLTKLYQSIGRSVDAYASLASALDGLVATSEMPEIGEAQALLAILERDESVKAELARRERRVQLQLDYGAALISARGYGAEETVKAFERARELSAGAGATVDRLALLYGTWLGAVTTESFEEASKAAAALVAEATEARNANAMGVAHRAMGATLLYAGSFHDAKREFDAAISLLGSTDDAELARRFNGAPRAAAHILRAIAAWVMSEFDQAAQRYRRGHGGSRARRRRDDARLRVRVGGDLRSRLPRRGADRSQRDPSAQACGGHWPAHLGAGGAGIRALVEINVGRDIMFSAGELRAGRLAFKEVGHDKIITPIIGVLAAEAEVRKGRADRGARPDQGAYYRNSCERSSLAGGGVATRQWRSAATRPFRQSGSRRSRIEAAVDVSREHGARTFELRAALSLARFYQSIARGSEAKSILGSALEGFRPTPTFPEIVEAQALFATLPS